MPPKVCNSHQNSLGRQIAEHLGGKTWIIDFWLNYLRQDSGDIDSAYSDVFWNVRFYDSFWLNVIKVVFVR